MEALEFSERREPTQPFQCLICSTRFTRHENLKRHSTLHSRSNSQVAIQCEYCQATFSRPDLRNRHMKRKHPEHHPSPTTKTSRRRKPSASHLYSRDGPQSDKENSLSPSTDDSPGSTGIENDQRMELDEVTFRATLARPSFIRSPTISQDFLYEPESHISGDHAHPSAPRELFSTPQNNFDLGQLIPNRLLEADLYRETESLTPSNLQISRGCELFFSHVSHFLPFLHRDTFSPYGLPLCLVLGVLCLGYQYGEDPDCDYEPGSGARLARSYFHQARAFLSSSASQERGSLDGIHLIQSYLLLQICAMMYLCGEDSAYGLDMHTKTISLARSVGLMQPLDIKSATTQDLDSLWRQFILAESHKRTLFAVHQIDALWYQILSIPRSISHLEIKHDLPCPEAQWNASSSADWAHRRLLSENSGPSLQYSDAVRLFLSSENDHTSIAPFDPYGAINIAQFLISSAREISGWSTMTGILSIERFSALRASLVTLGPFMRPLLPTQASSALCEATWEIAMLELHMWSPSHTGGIVAASMDAVLNQSTYLSPSCKLLCEPNTAMAVQPHVNWFLRYLDSESNPQLEAPWVALYAYKAFLIAWELLCGEIPDAMAVVGIENGDSEGALRWAKMVFQRRSRWQLGRLILSCLESLKES